MLINFVSPRAKNRLDIIELFDKLDERQVFQRDPDWAHFLSTNNTTFGHISLQGFKVLARMKNITVSLTKITESENPKRFCAVSVVQNGNSQRVGAYSVPSDCENGKIIASEMATRNALRQTIPETEAVLFIAKPKVYFAHPIYKKNSEDAAIVKKAIREKMPESIILDPANILKGDDPPNSTFCLAFNCIRQANQLVFITSDRGFITKGVFREIQYAFQLQREILFCNLKRFETGLRKIEFLPIYSKKQIKNLHSNNPNEFGRVVL